MTANELLGETGVLLPSVVTIGEGIGFGVEEACVGGLPVAAGSGVDCGGAVVVVAGEDVAAEEPDGSTEPDIVDVSVRKETVAAAASPSTAGNKPSTQVCNAATSG